MPIWIIQFITVHLLYVYDNRFQSKLKWWHDRDFPDLNLYARFQQPLHSLYSLFITLKLASLFYNTAWRRMHLSFGQGNAFSSSHKLHRVNLSTKRHLDPCFLFITAYEKHTWGTVKLIHVIKIHIFSLFLQMIRIGRRYLSQTWFIFDRWVTQF